MSLGAGRRRTLGGRLASIVNLLCVLLGLWTVYQACFLSVDVLTLAMIFACAVLSLLFLIIGASTNSDPHNPSVCDFVLSGLSVLTGVFFAMQQNAISSRISLFDELSGLQTGFGLLTMFLVSEATRRSVGYGLLAVVIATIVYNLFGDQITGYLGHGPISVSHLLDIAVYTVDGVFGLPVRVAATYAFMFVLFGTLLEKSGGGEFFYSAAALLTGNRPGGPAKIAVVSSGMFGAISGSPTSDVITTGSVTIPTMKRTGYPATLAGGIEVAASTGGSLLPPVMGAAAFIMAEYTGITYWTIASAALIPAVLFYAAVMAHVHLHTMKLGLTGTSSVDRQSQMQALGYWYVYVVPVAVLVATLAAGYSPTYAGLTGSLSIIVTSQVFKGGRLGPKRLYEVLATTTRRMLAVTAACAAAGLVIAGLTMTGLSQKFTYFVLVFGEQHLAPALIVGAVITIILGMGMPTSSAYILAAILVGPVFVNELGLPALSAHMFLFYFSVLSAMTPPIAVAAYAASAIADENPMHIAVNAIRLSVAAVLIPVAFVNNPSLLLAGAPAQIIIAVFVTLFAIMLFAMAIEGYFRCNVGMYRRVLLGGAALWLLAPVSWWSLVPAAVGGVLIVQCWRRPAEMQS